MCDDRDAIAEKIVRNQHRVFAYIVTLLPNRDDAEDVFQNTLLILWGKWKDYDPSRDFFSWACGVAHNEVRNVLRRNPQGRVRLSDDLLEQIAQTRQMADGIFESRSQFLVHCLKKLPGNQRGLIERCYLGSEPIKVIASELGISSAALTMRLQRIRKLLFRCVNSAIRAEEGVL